MTKHSTELDFNAFLYVAGELDEPQRTEFESRLSDDPVAQEAVVNAMRLTDGVLQAMESDPQIDDVQKVAVASLERSQSVPAHRNPTGKRSLMPMSLFAASAALLLLAFSWAFVFSPDSDGTTSIADDDSIAVAWADHVQPVADETPVEEEAWDDTDELINVDTASWMAIAIADIGPDELGETNDE